MDVRHFKTLPLMAILRGVEPHQLSPLLDAVIASGLHALEITLNTPHALELIHQAQVQAEKQIAIGAGTVLSLRDMHAALDAGATFIVMPALIREITRYCVENLIPAFPGALTPREILQTWRAGATMVKLFPASCFGPDYFKEIKGPFPDVELMACGGVTPENLPEYYRAGASAFALGASVFKKEWLDQGDYTRVEHRLQEYIHAYQTAKIAHPR